MFDIEILTFNFVVISFFDIFFRASLSPSGIKLSSSGVKGFKPKIAVLKSRSVIIFPVPGFVDESSADRALLDG